MSVKIITDSTADMPDSGKSRILTVPMHVRFGSEEYLDGVTLSRQDFYEKLAQSEELPATSQPSPAAFAEIFEQVVSAGDTAVVITISAKLSGTYQSACIAAEEYAGKVFVVDSATVALGTGAFALRAVQLAEDGLEAAAVAAQLEKEKPSLHVLAVLDTLEYLKKGGRISPAVAFAGGLLSIKPVVTTQNGEVAILGKARGSKQGNNLLVQQIEKAGGVDFARPVLLGYTGQSDAQLQRYYEDSRPLWENGGLAYDPVILSGAIGTHLGPGAVGVAFFAPQ